MEKIGRVEWTLDAWDIENYSKEFSDCVAHESGTGSALFCMCNEAFSDVLFAFFKNQFPGMQQFKTPFGQFFTFGKKGKKQLVKKVLHSLEEKRRLVSVLENVLNEIEGV